MNRIEWNDKLATGIGEVDTQHHELVDLINTVLSLMESDDPKATLQEALQRLKSYTSTHFRDEERLMDSIGFPHLAEHHEEHLRLEQSVDDFIARFGQEQLGAFEVHAFMRQWLLDHLMGWDFNIVEHMKNTGKS